jgi:hypothetical protein
MTEAVAQRRPPVEEPVLEPKRLATNVFAVILHDLNDLSFPEESEKFCTLDNISLLDRHLQELSKNVRILLANSRL